jgi:hypothetical protein
MSACVNDFVYIVNLVNLMMIWSKIEISQTHSRLVLTRILCFKMLIFGLCFTLLSVGHVSYLPYQKCYRNFIFADNTISQDCAA